MRWTGPFLAALAVLYAGMLGAQTYEVPSIFRLTKGSIHATSFSFDC